MRVRFCDWAEGVYGIAPTQTLIDPPIHPTSCPSSSSSPYPYLARFRQHGRGPAQGRPVGVPPVGARVLKGELGRRQRGQVHGVVAHADDACLGGIGRDGVKVRAEEEEVQGEEDE